MATFAIRRGIARKAKQAWDKSSRRPRATWARLNNFAKQILIAITSRPRRRQSVNLCRVTHITSCVHACDSALWTKLKIEN